MPYAYYAKLKPKQKAIYRRSDEIAKLALPPDPAFPGLTRSLEKALAAEQRAPVEQQRRSSVTPC